LGASTGLSLEISAGPGPCFCYRFRRRAGRHAGKQAASKSKAKMRGMVDLVSSKCETSRSDRIRKRLVCKFGEASTTFSGVTGAVGLGALVACFVATNADGQETSQHTNERIFFTAIILETGETKTNRRGCTSDSAKSFVPYAQSNNPMRRSEK